MWRVRWRDVRRRVLGRWSGGWDEHAEGLELKQVVERVSRRPASVVRATAWLGWIVTTTDTPVTSVTSWTVRLRSSSATRMMPWGASGAARRAR